MTLLLRSFIVWLMLLALPYQGYASAQMLLCVVPAPAEATHAAMVMPAGPHDHAAMLAAQAGHQHDGDKSSGHTGSKCTGAACCAAAAPLLALNVTGPALPSVTRWFPHYAGFLPAVDLAHPERPPQGLQA